MYRQIQELPWIEDGLFGEEHDTIKRLLDSWYHGGARNRDNLKVALTLPWVQDSISETEHDIIRWLLEVHAPEHPMAVAISNMPFLQVSDTADALAIRAIGSLAYTGILSTLLDHPTVQDGITDDETVLVAAAGTLYRNPALISWILDPGRASIETVSSATKLTPDLKISVVRTGNQPQAWTAGAVSDAVDFVERTMQLPLPTDHVVVVLNDEAVVGNFAGTNYGFAIGYLPEYEQRQNDFESGLVHEVAHYYWRENQNWVDEGLANTIEHMRSVETGLSPGQLQTQRGDCEAHDLEMLSEWNPTQEDPRFYCNYYLGELLFRELREGLDDEEFGEKLRELYLLSLKEYKSGVHTVRRVFTDQNDVIDKHWAGALNAPENRPSDEGVDRTSHDLIQWDQYPTYDGRLVSFRGTLLNGAVLSTPTIDQAREGGGYFNFTLSPADGYEHSGGILPPLRDGRQWRLGPADTIATAYQLDEGAFTVTFPFSSWALDNPSDYVVVVWGFKDDMRTPSIGDDIDILGYARIRDQVVEE